MTGRPRLKLLSRRIRAKTLHRAPPAPCAPRAVWDELTPSHREMIRVCDPYAAHENIVHAWCAIDRAAAHDCVAQNLAYAREQFESLERDVLIFGGDGRVLDALGELRDALARFDEPSCCTTCNGSGEGRYDGATCWRCGGAGVRANSTDSLYPD